MTTVATLNHGLGPNKRARDDLNDYIKGEAGITPERRSLEETILKQERMFQRVPESKLQSYSKSK